MRSLGAPVFVWFALFILSLGEASPKVKTKIGKIKGVTKTTTDGGEVDAFLGIPYGAPATGENRFAPPKEADPWSGTLDATTMPRPCYQIVDENFRRTEFISSLAETEDCLKLNIWAPKHRSEKSAVMVWIHGGAFAMGSIDLPFYDASVIASQGNVIVVSVNYRLSAFGFLYLEHPSAPGNVGLMDQALGLQWVKKNIEAFGGNPDQVTIFGESAGGASVGLQLLAPSSLDLFKNAILQSGSAPNFWATQTPKEALAHALSLAGKAGCPIQENKREDTVKCLQNLSAEKIHKLMVDLDDLPVKMSFKPVVDGKFLPKEPSTLLSNGKFCGEKNVMVGYTKEDGSFILPLRAPQLELKEESVYSDEQIRQVMSDLTKSYERTVGLQLDLVKHMYSDWNDPEDRVSARSLMVHYLTDRWFACGAIQTAEKMAHKGNKVYFYRFDHVPQKPWFLPLPKWTGSSHGDELPVLFGSFIKNAKEPKTEEAKLSKQMIRYWTNFAKAGDPNDDYLPVWPQYNSKDKLLLQFNAKVLSVNKTDRLRECAFWEHIFPKTDSDKN